MKNNILLIILTITIIFTSISTINAENTDFNTNTTYDSDLEYDSAISKTNLNISNNEFNQQDKNKSPNNNLSDDTNITKQKTLINSSSITLFYKNGTRFTIILLDENNNALSNHSINFIINGITYDRTTNINGKASIAINLPAGEYNITTIFNETDLYKQSSTYEMVTVLPTIIAKNITKYYKNNTQFLASFLDNHGNFLNNSIVLFNINGIFYNRTTNDKGEAKLNINLSPGNYVLTAIQLDNGFESAYSIKVLSTIKADNIVKYYKNSTQYIACFLDNTGKPLTGINVSFNINGIFYNRTTDNKGEAKLNINLSPGNYVLTAINNQTQQGNIIKVLPTIEGIDLIKAFHDKNQYYAKFLDNTGKPLTGISVSFNIHGIIYNRTTNIQGMAKLNINLAPGEYVLTAYNSYDGLFLSNIIKVLNNISTKIQVENATFMENESKKVEIVLLDEIGYTLENKLVELSINNKIYNSITNSNGKAEFILDLSAGLYDATYSFKGNDVYQSSTNLKKIRVLNGQDVLIDVLNPIIYNKDKFSIKVKNLNNTPLKNITISFNVNNQIIKTKTNNNGIATINLSFNNEGIKTIYYNVNQIGFDSLKRSFDVVVISSKEPTLTNNVTSLYQGTGSKFIVTLQSGKVKLKNQKITLTINGIDYNRTTDSEGVASITINLNSGKYEIKCFYAGNSKLNSVTKIFNLTVIQRLKTNIEHIGENIYVLGSANRYYVHLTDSNNNNLENQKIIFTLNNMEITSITNKEGISSLDISDLKPGFYEINCRFEEFEKYLASDSSSYIRIFSSDLKGNGYWVWGSHMYKLDLSNLAHQGATDLFLLSSAISIHGENNVVKWIKKANSYGFRVHIWMTTFYDGEFISPVLNDGTPDYNLFSKKINDAKHYASLPGVSGIHLDYLRFPGTAYKHPGGLNAINEFVKLCGEAIKSIKPNIIYSAAVMPEPSGNIRYYGQDVSVMGKYLDVIMPMIYKGNYNSGTGWIGSTTKWFVEHSSGARIWAGLQTYESDENVVLLSIAELTNDSKTAINNGASGIILFRWGITNFINFNRI